MFLLHRRRRNKGAEDCDTSRTLDGLWRVDGKATSALWSLLRLHKGDACCSQRQSVDIKKSRSVSV